MARSHVGCSAASTDSAETPLTITRAATDVTRAPMLHWNGSWQLSGVTVTADLRAMGTGDVFGMLRADGGTAQVLLIGDEHTYIKADRAPWRANGASAEEAAAFGTRWVDDRGTSDPAEASAEGPPITGEILSLDLAWLARAPWATGCPTTHPPTPPRMSPQAAPRTAPRAPSSSASLGSGLSAASPRAGQGSS
ncbi:hypothetical protein, partial [Streptomyces eurythermus]